jgi:hypothetical protein
VARHACAVHRSRVFLAMLYGVQPWDMGPVVLAVCGAMAVGPVASLLPAVRAARVDAAGLLRRG